MVWKLPDDTIKPLRLFDSTIVDPLGVVLHKNVVVPEKPEDGFKIWSKFYSFNRFLFFISTIEHTRYFFAIHFTLYPIEDMLMVLTFDLLPNALIH